MSILVVMEQRAGAWNKMSWETLAAAQQIGAELNQPVADFPFEMLASHWVLPR